MSTKKDNFSFKDKFYMELALDLARARGGHTGTNPSVGCVIVKNDEIVSIGQTSFSGRPHAETNAIKNTFEDLKGSKMYVTLEPCSHHGVTPPCTNSIIKSKIGEVIYSVIDVDKRVKGKTFKILKSKNIKVKKGVLEDRVKQFYLPYFFNRKKKLPFVSGKIAVAKNHLIFSKNKRKITNLKSDRFTHFLRYKNDSILISYKTLNKDNPKLSCRIKNFNKFSPKRIILDKNLNMKINSYIFKTANKNNTIVFYKNAEKFKISNFKRKGIRLIKSNLKSDGYFDLRSILKKLYKLGCRNLLVEGGNDLTGTFLKKRLFNQFYLFKSSKKLSKLVDYKEFNFIKKLSQNYKIKSKINTKLGKDKITLYNR